MGFDPFNASNYYKVATQIPKFRNWGLTRLLADELNNEVRVAGELGRNVGKSTVSPIIRTKIGDVEINNPGLYYHQSGLGKAKNFFNTNRMRTPQEEYWLKQEYVPLTLRTGVVPGFPQNPGRAMFSQGKLWYGLNPEQFPDLLVTAKEMPVANSKAGIVRGNLQKLESQGTRRVTSDNIDNIGPHTNQNTSAYTYIPGYGYRQIQQEPRTSLKFFERPQSRISEAEKAGVPRGERNLKNPSYTLKDARKEAQEFAEKWGYDLPKNASLKDIEDLYNRHNTFFRGTTTEYFDVEKDRIAKELGLKTLTPEQFLQYSATHSHPGTDRIWVTPFDHYSGFYGTVGEGFQGQGQVSAVMRPWKTPKLKDWKEKASWELGFKEDINNPVITPWVERSPGATIDRGPQTELLIKGPLIYRGLAKDFKGTLQNKLNYSRIKGLREPYLLQPPQEIIVNFKSGGNIIKKFKSRNK